MITQLDVRVSIVPTHAKRMTALFHK
jgi:hypothetical protein